MQSEIFWTVGEWLPEVKWVTKLVLHWKPPDCFGHKQVAGVIHCLHVRCQLACKHPLKRKKWNSNKKLILLAFKIKVAHLHLPAFFWPHTLIHRDNVHYNAPHMNVCQYLLSQWLQLASDCRQLGIFHVNYRRMQQSAREQSSLKEVFLCSTLFVAAINHSWSDGGIHIFT